VLWLGLALEQAELQTSRTQDLSFPRTKNPYGELSSPGCKYDLTVGQLLYRI